MTSIYDDDDYVMSGPASSTSQARLRPVQHNGLAGAGVPTAATLDALEAMEAGLGPAPPPPNGSSPDGSEGGTRTRRWSGWRGTADPNAAPDDTISC